jgi:hypothetical protein
VTDSERMTGGAEQARRIKAAMEERAAEREAARPAAVDAPPMLSFDPGEHPFPPTPQYAFHRKVDTGGGATVEVVVWEDQPDWVVLYDVNGESLEQFTRDAAHAVGMAFADAIHRRG